MIICFYMCNLLPTYIVQSYMRYECVPERVYDWATSLGRRPFCNWTVSPFSERLHSHMSRRNNMRYKYYRICFGIYACLWRFGCKLCNRSLGIHEPKWTSHVKHPSGVAQSYTSTVHLVEVIIITNHILNLIIITMQKCHEFLTPYYFLCILYKDIKKCQTLTTMDS